jgi:hypothetical protein
MLEIKSKIEGMNMTDRRPPFFKYGRLQSYYLYFPAMHQENGMIPFNIEMIKL